ncbi:MAG: 3-beta hydroxysteroid dehydrogenase, partial [Nocardioides sp.]
MRVAVAGGTGLVGRLVVAELERRGHAAMVLARSAGIDVRRSDQLAGALDGAAVVVDCLNVATTRGAAATEFFTSTTASLLDAERAAGVGRHLLLSIVGIDRNPLPYYRAKLAQEHAARGGAGALTVLRATQFHEFAGQLLAQLRRGPVVPVPRMLSAPVAAAEVALALADLTEQPPDRGTVELGGPERLAMPDLVRRLARARGIRAAIVP